jgi:hypothetical protein
MTFTRNTLGVLQQLIATNRIGVYDNNADASYQALVQARTEVDAAIHEMQMIQSGGNA